MNVGLAINTPEGQKTLRDEATAIAILKRHHPMWTYMETPKHKPATVDAIIRQFNRLIAVVEAKGRDMSLEQLAGQYEWRWLVTAEKLDKAAQIASGLSLPLVGLLYLRPSKVLLAKTLFDPDRGWMVSMDRAKTLTQATCNGGIALRENSYVDMSNARIMR